MGTTGDMVKKLIEAQLNGDPTQFRAIAEEFASDERKKNHPILARDIERLLKNGTLSSELPSTLTLIGRQ
jgi:hypothetical protein